jgi:hypothetical protein
MKSVNSGTECIFRAVFYTQEGLKQPTDDSCLDDRGQGHIPYCVWRSKEPGNYGTTLCELLLY